MRIVLSTLFLIAFGANAGTISSLNPSTFEAFSGEHFITVRGQSLGNQVIYEGPLGRFEVEASSWSGDSVTAWVPIEIINQPGRYELWVRGSAGLSGPARFDVLDSDHPLVVLGQDPIVVVAESPRGAHVEFEVFAYGGRDPNPVVRCDPSSGSLFPFGPSHVQCTARNSFGETASGGVYIYVYDGTGPVLDLPDDIVVETESDDAVVEFEASASDAVDGPLPVSCTPASGSRFPAGETRVECSAIDSNGNSAVGFFNVTVNRRGEPPVLFIQVPGTIHLEATGPAGARAEFEVTTTGSTDPDPEVTCSPASGSTFALGTTAVLCIATDSFGNRAEGTFDVGVNDTSAPEISHLTDIEAEATSSDGAVVTFSPTATDVVEGRVAVTCTPASGSRFPVGQTTVQCTASDSRGNTDTDGFTVIVRQTGGGPVLFLQVPSAIAAEATSSAGASVEFAVTTTGSTDPNPAVTCSPASGSTFALGTTTVLCIATDTYGNRVEGTFDVSVTDTTAPEISHLTDIEAEATSSDGAVVTFSPTATDLVEGSVEVTCTPASGSRFPVGQTVVQCTASDSRGNTDTGGFVVTVHQSGGGPVLFLQVPSTIAAEATSSAGASVEFAVTTTGSTDPNPAVTCSPASGSTFALGTTSVLCIATDTYGNRAEGTFDVVVGDSVAPMIVSVSATPNLLAPANHKLIDVAVTVDATDAIDPMPQCFAYDVTANEAVDAPGSGNTEFDWMLTGPLSVQLRAERSGEGSDRIYRVFVRCSDASGNDTTGSVEVRVPKSPSNDDATIATPKRRRSVGRR